MNDWNAWHTLLAVIRTGTFDAAASQLGVNATTVSRRVRQLEQSYGTALIARAGSRLEATSTASKLMPQLNAASEALTALVPERGQRDAVMRQLVRVTGVDYICNWILARAIGKLRESSRIRIELTADDRNLSLSRREVDFALRFAPPEASRIQATRVGMVRYALFAATEENPDELAWLSLDTRNSHLPEVRWTNALANDSATGIGSTGNSLEILLTMTRARAGKAILPRLMVDAQSGLTEIAADPSWERPLWLLWHPSVDDTEEHGIVSEWITEATSAALADGAQYPASSQRNGTVG